MITVAAITGCMSCSDGDGGDARDAYIGAFKIDEQNTGTDGIIRKDSYNITIVKSAVNKDDVIITNILNTAESVNATVNGTSFIIPQQTLRDYGVSGSGRRDGNSLHFSILATLQGYGQLNFTCDGYKQ
jgi:hypothetical protein